MEAPRDARHPDRLLPLMTSETGHPPHGGHSPAEGDQLASVYRIRLTDRTGRFEKR